MSIMHSAGAPEKEAQLSSPSFDKEKIIGCLYLVAAVVVLSSNVVLQVTSVRIYMGPILPRAVIVAHAKF